MTTIYSVSSLIYNYKVDLQLQSIHELMSLLNNNPRGLSPLAIWGNPVICCRVGQKCLIIHGVGAFRG